MATQQWVAIRRFRSRHCRVAATPLGRVQHRGRPTDRRRPSRRPQRAGRPRSPPQTPATVRRRRPAEPRFAEPPLADDIDARDLDRGARAGLRSLPKDLAEKIAPAPRRGRPRSSTTTRRPRSPTRSTPAASRRGSPSCAKAYGVAAYRTGDYATALAELRAVRRMTGDPSYLPMMADCERGLGRPERALALVARPRRRAAGAGRAGRAGDRRVGARRDRGEAKAAVVALQGPDSTARRAAVDGPALVRLRRRAARRRPDRRGPAVVRVGRRRSTRTARPTPPSASTSSATSSAPPCCRLELVEPAVDAVDVRGGRVQQLELLVELRDRCRAGRSAPPCARAASSPHGRGRARRVRVSRTAATQSCSSSAASSSAGPDVVDRPEVAEQQPLRRRGRRSAGATRARCRGRSPAAVSTAGSRRSPG